MKPLVEPALEVVLVLLGNSGLGNTDSLKAKLTPPAANIFSQLLKIRLGKSANFRLLRS